MKVKDGLHISGKIKIDTFRAGMVDAVSPLLEQYNEIRNMFYSEHMFPYWRFHERPHKLFEERMKELATRIKEIKSEYFIHTAVECPNLIMDSPNYGLDLVIQRLVGINTYSGNILWIEIGTGSTTPTVNDIALTTPSLRMAVNFQEDFATTDAIVQAYATDAQLANVTYQEVGGFVDGTSTIGTGQIFNHALLSPTFTKTAGEDVTIQIDISVSNS
jgi:hypothetical protein